ncbi:MAG: hypothetical protein E5X07_15755 [Mesorhizobium sp.]|nr:MAG: hypothetical protein E5X07_15755 [Mesorhizobium sp.]
MRFIEEFIAGSIILIGMAIEWLLIWAFALSVVGTGLSLLIRGIYWLRFGHWITSICDGHLRFLEFTSHQRDRAFLCVDAYTGWAGVDQLIEWSFLQGDMSLVLLLLGFTLFGILMVCALMLRYVPRDNWLRKYYESRD